MKRVLHIFRVVQQEKAELVDRLHMEKKEEGEDKDKSKALCLISRVNGEIVTE